MTYDRQFTAERLEGRLCLHGGDELSADNFAINTGGADYVDSTGLRWEDDRGFAASKTAQVVTSNNAIANTDLDPLFRTARYDFNMKFAATVPDGTYTVKLYFAEQRLTGVGKRVFGINVENSRVLSDFDIYKTAGGKNIAVVKTFTTTVKDGTLNIDFVTGSSTALVDAIRVQPAGAVTPPSTTFRPGTIAWTTKATAPIRREEAVSFVSRGKVYVVGGYVDAAYRATTRVDAYDPATNRWTRMKDAPSKFTHVVTATDAGGNVWFSGGFIGDSPRWYGTTAVWKYSPSTDSWSQQKPLPVSRGAGGSAILNNKLYYLSGSLGDRTGDSAACYVLDLANTAAGWKQIASMPAARNHFAATAVGGKIYAIGGSTALVEKTVAHRDVYVYDPATNAWSATTPLPEAYSHFSATESVYKDRYILLAGGEGAHNVAKSVVRAFDTVTRQWATLTSLPDLRRAAAGGIVGNTYVVSGGYKYGYDELDQTWTADLSKLEL